MVSDGYSYQQKLSIYIFYVDGTFYNTQSDWLAFSQLLFRLSRGLGKALRDVPNYCCRRYTFQLVVKLFSEFP